MRKLLILLSGSFLYCSFALAQETETTFENANSAYNAGQFEKAVMLYKEILESGQQSAELYFNLANSLLPIEPSRGKYFLF